MDSEGDKENDQSSSYISASIGTKFPHKNIDGVSIKQSQKDMQSEREWDPDESQSRVSKSNILDRYRTAGQRTFTNKPKQKKEQYDDASQKNGASYMQRQFKLQRTNRRSVFQRKNQIVAKTLRQHIIDIWKNSIINRNNKYKQFYNYFYTLITLIQSFVISIHICFGIHIFELINYASLYLFISLNFLDVFISINTDIVIKGLVVNDRQKILSEYIKKNYLVDIIPLVLLLIYNSIDYDLEYRYILLPFLLKMRRFNALAKHFEESLTLDDLTYNIVQLFKLLSYNLFVSHFVTCIWVFEAKSIYTDNNWMVFFKISDYSWQEQYIRGYYFTIVTMCTVGYGDIYPINALENVMSILTMLTASGIFGYSINQIGSIFNQIQEYMERKKISSKLQYKIREYLDNFWREEMLIQTENETQIVNQLNNSLKNELFQETYFVNFQNSILYEYFTSEVLQQTIKYIKEIQCIPEQVIFSQGKNLKIKFIDDYLI